VSSRDRRELSKFHRRFRAFQDAASNEIEKIGNNSYRLKDAADAALGGSGAASSTAEAALDVLQVPFDAESPAHAQSAESAAAEDHAAGEAFVVEGDPSDPSERAEPDTGPIEIAAAPEEFAAAVAASSEVEPSTMLPTESATELADTGVAQEPELIAAASAVEMPAEIVHSDQTTVAYTASAIEPLAVEPVETQAPLEASTADVEPESSLPELAAVHMVAEASTADGEPESSLPELAAVHGFVETAPEAQTAAPQLELVELAAPPAVTASDVDTAFDALAVSEPAGSETLAASAALEPEAAIPLESVAVEAPANTTAPLAEQGPASQVAEAAARTRPQAEPKRRPISPLEHAQFLWTRSWRERGQWLGRRVVELLSRS